MFIDTFIYIFIRKNATCTEINQIRRYTNEKQKQIVNDNKGRWIISDYVEEIETHLIASALFVSRLDQGLINETEKEARSGRMGSKRAKREVSDLIHKSTLVDFSPSAGNELVDGVAFSFSRAVRDKYEHMPNS